VGGRNPAPAAFGNMRRIIMDEFKEGYEEENYEILPDGVYQVEITEVTAGTSKSSGLPMLIVEMKPEGPDITLRYYLVKNEYYNKNATKLFDCFGIRRGDFEYGNWKGKKGKAYIGKKEQETNGIRYHEIKNLIAGESGQQGSEAAQGIGAE
jgi:hypothetical protein